ncbi:NmrA family NAD(P)-binding protein [Rhodopseudomonas palustris]|uniref:SDR family NAD(P)-dependent oxidoreductase n=1 Tax=Rhodopseudomonas palustris TaxID=1076 RepID=A0A418V1T9_RHOPL|nr:NmrA family NAD(P)-binding protein [Rhodopseudomonas palustris]RJF69841.1 SDR family NAD(P)-dependent oxidoreductase [Rhodopseudomonas palustris]
MSRRPRTSSHPRIVVAGATGRVGAALTTRMAADPVDLVALTRDVRTDRIPDGVAIATVDFSDVSSLSSALRGADRLFLAHGTSDRQLANEIALIDAAVAAGVSHIVKLSVMGPPTRLHPFDWHMKIEADLATRDIGYTVLRPSTFVNILARAAKAVAEDSWGGAAGDGRVNLIDTRDIAEVARHALLDDRHIESQRAYHLTGPRAVSMPQIAEQLSRLLGRKVVYQHRTASAHRDVLIASGINELAADLLLGLDQLFNQSVLAETTTTVAEVTGREPRSTEDWLGDNIAAFQTS